MCGGILFSSQDQVVLVRERFRTAFWLKLGGVRILASISPVEHLSLETTAPSLPLSPLLTSLLSDMTIASPTASFGLPESLRGIYAGAGGLPRLVRTVGLPLASEISMTGRTLSAAEALSMNLINRVSASPASLLEEAVALATKVADISPDAIIVTRAAIRETWETGSVERGYQLVDERMKRGLMEGENSREGLAAFREKRKPVWKASKL